jgi:hypothetical protein
MTPFQKKFPNVTKETLFAVVHSDVSCTFTTGSVVQLYEDDGTESPCFKLTAGYTKYHACDGEPGAYAHLSCLEKIEVKKPMKLLYDIQSVLSAAKYLEQYHEDTEREDIAKEILADIRGFAKTDLDSTSTMGYVILFDRGNEYVSAEVFVTPNFADGFFMEEEV